jgi:deglycase
MTEQEWLMPKITKAKILILATDGFEQSELEVPLNSLREAGALVHVAAPKSRKSKSGIRGWKDKDWGKEVPVDSELSDVSENFYDALVLPGGQMNPDTLRGTPEAMALIKAFLESGKPVAAICHAPWLLIEANAVRGRKATSFSTIKTDLVNAGAQFVDAAVVADQGIVTSRNPGDLTAFVAKIIEEVEEGKHNRASLAA